MDRAPRATLSWEYDLRRDLGGSFTAHARGLLATEFALLGSDGQEFGRLRLRGPSVAEFRSGGHSTTLKTSRKGYRMVASDEDVLAAGHKGRSIDELVISCSGRTYEARINLFRNFAIASYPGGERAARLSGGSMGRSYEALFAAEDGCALLGAIFLLWHVAANRRRAYRMGSPTGGENM